MDTQQFEKHAACSEPIYANASRAIALPVGKTAPYPLANVMLNEPGDIIAWHYEYGTLPELLDRDPGDYEPSEVDVYCENSPNVCPLRVTETSLRPVPLVRHHNRGNELAPALLIVALESAS